MNSNLKRQLFSIANTFVTGFGLGIVAYLKIAPLDASTFGKAAIFGLLLAGLRHGVKMVSETLFQKAG